MTKWYFCSWLSASVFVPFHLVVFACKCLESTGSSSRSVPSKTERKLCSVVPPSPLIPSPFLYSIFNNQSHCIALLVGHDVDDKRVASLHVWYGP